MRNDHQMEEKLWAYIDGHGTADERSVVEKMIAGQSAWREKYNDLMEIHQTLLNSDLEAPSLRFSKNVMEEIAKLQIAPATRTYINKKIIAGIGLFFISLLVAMLVYGFSQVEFSNTNNSSIDIDLSKIDLSKIFNNTLVNIFMMINVMLGLVLLDFYFSNKRKQFRKEA